MVDEYLSNYPYQKRTFISKLNPESPPFQPSSYYQPLQEVSQSKLISQNNHLHIQPITNGYQQNSNSTSIQSTEPLEYIPSQTHFIQESKLEYQQSTISSYIQPVKMSSEEEDKNQISLEKTLDNTDRQSNEIPVAQSPSPIETDDQVRQTEPDDILGNQSLLKQTIIPGILDTRPTRNTLATVSYQLFLIDSSTLDSRLIETVEDESFFVGEYDILPAIDITIQLMDRGEHATIDSDVRHCYGTNGCEEKGIPPITSENTYRMKIDLELHDWKYPAEIQTLTINERINWSDKKRQRGNILYRRKEYISAIQCYQNALKFLDTTEHPLLEEEENQSSTLIDRYIQVQNNLAQVYLLNNKYEECLAAIDNVLKHDPKNIKALFRQAKALIELGNYDHALQILKLLIEKSSKDLDKDKVNEMIHFCQTKLTKYHQNEKEIYKRMFQSKTTTTTNEQVQIQNTKKTENKSNNWWTYIAVGGSAALAAMGVAAFLKYR